VVTATGMKTRIGRAIAATHAAGEEYLTFGGDARSGRRGDDAGAGAASWFPLTTASSFDRVLSDVVYVLSAAGLVVCACLSVTLLVWGGGGGGGGGRSARNGKEAGGGEGDGLFSATSYSVVLFIASVGWSGGQPTWSGHRERPRVQTLDCRVYNFAGIKLSL
jgi:magnesium-transporting ATPase (P-type)